MHIIIVLESLKFKNFAEKRRRSDEISKIVNFITNIFKFWNSFETKRRKAYHYVEVYVWEQPKKIIPSGNVLKSPPPHPCTSLAIYREKYPTKKQSRTG